MKIELRVNGEPRELEVWEGESLLFALREGLGLPGSKNACEQGECGSCSVLLDGKLVCSCLVLAAQAQGHDVVRDLHQPTLKNSRRLFIDPSRPTSSSKSASRWTKFRFSEFTVSTGAAS